MIVGILGRAKLWHTTVPLNYLLALCIIVGLSDVRDLFLLTRYSGPVGVDGYYYLVQIRSFLDSGTFYYGTNTPLVLWLLAFAAKASGQAIMTVKLASILLHTLIAGSLFALIDTVFRSKALALLGTSISLLSVVHLIWIAEFVKQLGGVSLFLIGIVCIIEPKRSKFWRSVGFLFLAVSPFAHKSILLLLIGLPVLGVIFFAIERAANSRFPFLKVFAILVAVACLPLILSKQSILFQPEISEAVLSIPRFPVMGAEFEERLVLLFLAPASLFLSLRKLSSGSFQWARYSIGVTALSALLVTLNPFLVHEGELRSISERLDLFAHWQVSFLLCGFLWLASSTTLRLVVLLSVVCFLALGNTTLPKGLQRDFLERRESLVNALSNPRFKNQAQSVIFARHGDDFVVTFATGLPSRSTVNAPSPGVDRMWLLFATPCRTSEELTVISLTHRCTILVREGSPLLVTEAEKREIMALNPHLRRAPADLTGKVVVTNAPAPK